MKHDSPIFGPLLKAGEVNDATPTDQEAVTVVVKHYLHESTSGPMVQAMPRGGYGETAAAPSVVGHHSAVGSASGDEGDQGTASDTDVVMDSLSDAVRRQVEQAGGKYNVKEAVASGRGVVVNTALSEDYRNIQKHSGLLNVLVEKARQRKAKPRTMQGHGSDSVAGDAPSDGVASISTCDETGQISKSFVRRVTEAVVKRLSDHLVKADKNPATMNEQQLRKLLTQCRPDTPAFHGINRLLARAIHSGQ